MGNDVFISYHGGNGDDSRSSLPKAKELKAFLENHGVSCFLYKKTALSDFYDAIENALRECRHFILVACDLEMIKTSNWVRDEIKTFYAYCLNGQKSNYIFSAYVFGSLTEKDLYNYSGAFVTKDITGGEDGFERLLQMIKAKDDAVNEDAQLTEHEKENDARVKKFNGSKTFNDISRMFLRKEFREGKALDEVEFLKHCYKLTNRLKCMSNSAIKQDSENFIEDLFDRIQKCTTRKLYRIAGQSGTQKSLILQLLYLYLIRNYKKHNYEPLYINCDDIRYELDKSGIDASSYMENLFNNVTTRATRTPLLIFDGILSVNVNDYELDCALQQLFDSYSNSHLIIGLNKVFVYDSKLEKRSSLINGQFDNQLNLTPISLYDRDKCIDYINTLENLPIADSSEIYDILHSIGLITIDEEIVRIVCDFHDDTAPNIFDIFNAKLNEKFSGKMMDINRGAEYVFKFAFCSELNISDPIALKALKIICEEPIYLNCFIAIHYLNKLDEYSRTKDISFFNVIYPKEITRFITARIREVPHYEEILLDLGEHYNELQPHGQSEMSFYLGRIRSANYRKASADMLYKYYEQAKREINEKVIADKYYGKIYSNEDYIQDLFLLRGLYVSLVYCDERRGKMILNEYIRSLIDNDTSNMINRGFHLEYYGDKRYNPNQNLLDYRDNINVGERTLKILCNTVETQLKAGKYHPAFLLELFTIISLLQVRIETNRQDISFNLYNYVDKSLNLINSSLKKYSIDDNVISAYLKMTAYDFGEYLNNRMDRYSPQCAVCNEFLRASNVKRTGWVMQNINDPESIVEHMYSCWFIGLLCLPNDEPSVEGYNKQKILNMLLVHDIAETRLSDIPKYEKINYPDYDAKENEVMLGLLLKGTYGDVNNMAAFVEAWDEWYKMSTENARIAKDIDYLQAIYQFLMYNNREPEKFDEERRVNWIKEIREIKTETGKAIVKKIILDNPEFKETLKHYVNILI